MTTMHPSNTVGSRIRRASLPLLAVAMLVFHRFVWRPGTYPEAMAILTVPLILLILFVALRTLLGYDEPPQGRIELPPLPSPNHDDGPRRMR